MYLILQNTVIVDATDAEPALDGDVLTWGDNRMANASYVDVPDGTWSPADGYDKAWNGSEVVAWSAPTISVGQYEGIGNIKVRKVVATLGAVLSMAKYKEFKEHWSYDALMNATDGDVDFENEDAVKELDFGLGQLVADTSVLQAEIDAVLAALRPA